MVCLRGIAPFNHSIDSWNVGKVKNMREMFVRAFSFNQPLNN
nr:BspA family leucine-rich repeat surface protein [uncultured Campylobacter sp.]